MSTRLLSRDLRLGALLLMAAMATTSSGIAAPAGNDAVLARSLFDRGKALMGEGKTDEACDKFAESQRLDPRSGTLLNLAVCREKQGKTATAWLLFQDAIPLARKDKRQDREQLARTRIAEIEPKLSRLTIEVPSAAEGIEVSLDGVVVGKAAWREAAPVDPGEHQISAKAPGRKPWSTTVVIGAQADRKTVAVPELEAEPVAAAPVVSSAPPAPPPSAPVVTKRDDTLAYVIGGSGIVLLGAGAFFGWRASQKWDDAQSHCTAGVCDGDAASLSRQANTSAWISNIDIGVGLVGVGAAAWMLLSSPGEQPSSKARLKASPMVGSTTIGLGMSGSF